MKLSLKKLFSSYTHVYKRLLTCSPLKEVKVFNINVTALGVWRPRESGNDHKSPEDYKSLGDYKEHRNPQDHEESRKPRNPGSPQESKKTAKSQESRTSRIWKTGRLQEPRSRIITPYNIALFPPARGGEREEGKRDSSLKNMVKPKWWLIFL
jgi:hypothetical protein